MGQLSLKLVCVNYWRKQPPSAAGGGEDLHQTSVLKPPVSAPADRQTAVNSLYSVRPLRSRNKVSNVFFLYQLIVCQTDSRIRIKLVFKATLETFWMKYLLWILCSSHVGWQEQDMDGDGWTLRGFSRTQWGLLGPWTLLCAGPDPDRCSSSDRNRLLGHLIPAAWWHLVKSHVSSLKQHSSFILKHLDIILSANASPGPGVLCVPLSIILDLLLYLLYLDTSCNQTFWSGVLLFLWWILDLFLLFFLTGPVY